MANVAPELTGTGISSEVTGRVGSENVGLLTTAQNSAAPPANIAPPPSADDDRRRRFLLVLHGLFYLLRFPLVVVIFLSGIQFFKRVRGLIDKPLGEEVSWWISTQSLSAKLAEQEPLEWCPDAGCDQRYKDKVPSEIIEVDEEEKYQEILGMGTSLEAATAYNMARLNTSMFESIIDSLVDPDAGIGFNLFRVCIGSSDFSPLPFYSYDDDFDPSLQHFSIRADEKLVLPLILNTLARARRWAFMSSTSLDESADGPLFFASPWSAPGWMKSSGKLTGGTLKPEYHQGYAEYLLKFIRSYEMRGLPIYAMTLQNEPLADDWGYPTMRMEAADEADIVRRMGPMLEKAGLRTRMWLFDHNYVDWWYPKEVMNILEAKKVAKYVDGVAFHHYKGDVSMMTKMHELHPDKRIIFSEGSKFGIEGAAEIVKIFRNWACTYMSWVIMLDTSLKPNSGPFVPHTAMLTLHKNTLIVDYNFEYYMYGQFSKFIRRQATRIKSETAWKNSAVSDELPHVAFLNSVRALGAGNAATLVMVVVNVHKENRVVRLRYRGWTSREALLPPESIATFRWHPPTFEASASVMPSPSLQWIGGMLLAYMSLLHRSCERLL